MMARLRQATRLTQETRRAHLGKAAAGLGMGLSAACGAAPGASVSSVVPFGAFIVLDDLYIEGLVHVSELGTEDFLDNEALHELRGERTGLRYRLGDRLTVQVARVDLEARRIDFRLVKADTRKSLLAANVPEPKERERKRGESVEERRARQAKVERRQVRRGQLHKIGGKGVRGRDSKVRATKRGR